MPRTHPTPETLPGTIRKNQDTKDELSQFLPRPALDGGDGKIIVSKICLNQKPALVLEPVQRDPCVSLGENHTPFPNPCATTPTDGWPGFMIPPPPHYPPPFLPVVPPNMLGDPPSMHTPLLAAPLLATGDPVTGITKNKLRRENKRVRIARQEQQILEPEWWTPHTGTFVLPPELPEVPHHLNEMVPAGLALHHPAAALLTEYATLGCPTQTGKPWTVEQMQAAIDKGPHASALVPEAMQQFQLEIEEKVRNGQARILEWNNIRHDPPPELKISPVAMVPHKSRNFRAILDLSYPIKLQDGSTVPSVNETTIKTAPRGAIDQIGHSLQRIIHAFATSDPDAKIFMAKWDIKDGFWRLNCETGQEWNFAYVMPSADKDNPKLVIPTSLQMGWIESPPYFCAAAETARDVAQQYLQLPLGEMVDHKFIQHTLPLEHGLPLTHDGQLKFLLEVFMDDFIGLTIPTSLPQLRHSSNAVLYGIHDIFPPNDDESLDPISARKLYKGDGRWATQKDILGLTFDGEQKTLWLEEDKRDALLTVLSGWLRTAHTTRGGIPFAEFRSVISKIRHAFITIPAGNGLMSPFNAILRQQPKTIFLHKNSALTFALQDCRTFLRESVSKPTKCAALIQSWPDYIGITDASSFGAGGVVVGEGKAIPPTVFRVQWTKDITDNIVSFNNPKGTITNSDVEMAGLLLLWLAIEGVCTDLTDAHVALFSDNSPTVSWVDRLASRKSKVATQLLRALALRLQITRSSPLTSLHIPGEQNAITDIPSRSFGSTPKWFCNTDEDLLTLFNTTFPLPKQASWSVYRIAPALVTRVISALRMQVSSTDEWRRLPKRGSYGGPTGQPMSGLWDWTLIYRASPTTSKYEHSVALPDGSEQDTMAETAKSQLHRSLARSRPLERRSPWPLETTQQKWQEHKTK